MLLEYTLQNPDVEITSYRILISDSHYIKNKEMFDDFFSGSLINTEPHILLHTGSWKQLFLKSYETNYESNIKEILRMNVIHPSILNAVNHFVDSFGIDDRTLSVHVRLTDMNTAHVDEYAYVSFDLYNTMINDILRENPTIQNLFVCSDNEESIQKLIKIYGDQYSIRSIPDGYRVPCETSDNMTFQMEGVNLYEDFHVKLFIEMLTAAKCRYFLGRISDVSNFIFAYSDTIEKVYSVN
jgi:hypothetical protein